MTTDERLTALEETDARIVDLLERVVELIEETRHESQQTRRIWVAFAKHHGWPEDLENMDNDQ